MENQNKSLENEEKQTQIETENEAKTRHEEAAQKAEFALKILKITVIITAVCAVALPAVSIVLLVALDKAIYGLAALIASLCVFAVMLGVLAGVICYVRKQIKKMKSIENETICSGEQK